MHADAEAHSSHKLCYIFVLICYLFAFITEACVAYDRNTLINIRKGSAVDLETITAHDTFWPPSQTSGTMRHQKWCDREESRDKS